MSLPGNGIFVVKGEMCILMTAMRRGTRWSSHSYQDDDIDALMKNFQELKEILNKIDDLRLVEPNIFLSPFLDVIRSEETTGPITSLALSAVNKFLSYGIIDPTHSSIPHTVHNIADAVTHARFVGTDQSSDGVVLMRILQVLRTLTLAPEGSTLTNESLCEIMLSCFRICFETRLNGSNSLDFYNYTKFIQKYIIPMIRNTQNSILGVSNVMFPKLLELLRRTAEHYLKDMVQLVFMRLPQFSDDLRAIAIKQLKMRPGAMDQTRTKRRNRQSFRKKDKTGKLRCFINSFSDSEDIQSPILSKPQHTLRANHLSTTPLTPGSNIVDMQGSISQSTPQNVASDGEVASPSSFPVSSPNENQPECNIEITIHSPSSCEGVNEEEKEISENTEQITNESESKSVNNPAECEENPAEKNLVSSASNVSVVKAEEANPDGQSYAANDSSTEYINQRGIRFTPQLPDEITTLVPYGLACVRELFRFLISLCNPLDKQNTDVMIHLGLTLLTVCFEVGADSIGKYNTLLALVRDDLCRNLFSLLNTERLSVFAADLQVAFLMLESLRTHLKYQMECYLNKLMEIIVSDSVKVTYEHKEIALDSLLQLWRIPGFVSELYLNYDCDMYCTNLYEELTKLLAKNAFSATSGVYHTHLLSLDALLTVIEGIEMHCCDGKNENKPFNVNNDTLSVNNGTIENINNFIGKSSRVKLSENVPSKEELAARKSIKKWLPQGTEYFNHKPKKGIQFLQEHGVLKPELDIKEIALFLRENPGLDKKNDWGIYRIDDALRAFLEAFRLPGEAPVISLILEHFAEQWHKSNGEPFADVDSAFTLAYAVIMLNVDQHNLNAKKQSMPMSSKAFKKNLKGVNGGNDFEEEMLDEIYNTIKHDEIVMPAEQTGLVRENYLWKVLLRKGQSKEGIYLHVNGGTYDSELYQLIYGPIVAALSFVFEKSEEQSIYKRVMQGFERCAFIAANFNMTKNLDMLLLSLCKFTIFYNQQRQNNITVQFGANIKAQLALKTVFSLIHQHGDNLREGWKNLFDLILTLYSNGLLPKSYIEAEDFIEPSGKITLVYEEVQNMPKQDAGLLSSLYSYMVSTENLSKVPTPEEQQYIEVARECIKDCNLEQLITDSKFLHEEALFELVKALIEMSRGPDIQKSLVIQNRDRVMTIWQNVRDHIYTLVMNASVCDYQFLLERSVIGLLRIAIRLMRNEEMSPVVLQSLRMLLLLKSSTLCRISRQISFGLYELLKTSAQNIHTNTDWTIIFTLLECVGAGAQPPKPIVDESSQFDHGTKSDGETQVNSDEEVSTDRGYTSDSELTKSPKHGQQRPHSPIIVPNSPVGTPNTGGWILVGNEGEIQPVVGRTVPPTQYGLSLERNLGPHDPSSLIKCCESLAFLVRDVAHITPYNFDVCVHCIRTFVEASLHGCKRNIKNSNRESRSRKKSSNRRRAEAYRSRKSPTSSPDEEEEESDDDDLPSGYHQISIQLLDLMHTLHTRTAQIFKWWAEEGGEIAQDTSLWTQGWCPLLQGIARLCCDTRRQVRMSAITYLQRALLVHDLQTLSGQEWEQCFQRVLFPLLSYLLQPVTPKDPVSMEETRMRAATVLSKVFLHHLTPLLSLPTFFNLWLIILDFMDKYMHADKSDLLYEAIPESLKNMLLVMDSAKVFDGPDGKSPLWNATWDRMNKFLPNMKDELYVSLILLFFFNQQQEGSQNIDTQQPKPVQHNVENATRSSIILQPPSTQQPVSSHLFAHLGQMVSTPIGPTYAPDTLQKPVTITPMPQVSNNLPTIPNSTTPIMQPTLQTGMPYMPNFFTPPPMSQHTFPVLYNSPMIPSTTTTEIQPVSLYAEYMGNPYNVPTPDVYNLETQNEVNVENVSVSNSNLECESHSIVKDIVSDVITNVNLDVNKNNSQASCEVIQNNNPTNFFQSSNYFSNTSTASYIPVGSEILFGIEQNNSNIQGINIPITTNTEAKTTTDV
ncbi:hypothetical protein NQ314_021126 [Rhamnusium bicolor]|uniref:SEC7 domain-containing protein n=1 Tax=Rhamnusium bicolor TaxID=1586634 RepID=A0AAV8WJ15_9CUCU|nr:hypothetical protein NQ314_021126 [Rhamnusium bicolor]